MAMSREDMLRELELLPAWKLREPVGQHSSLVQNDLAENPASVAKAESEKTEDISTTSAIEMPSVVEEMVEPLGHIETVSKSTIKPAEKVVKIELLEGRTNAIKQMDWQALQDCVKDCQACNLAATRTQTVFGVGDANADWLIVGDAPGAEEDLKGEPFVGQVGQLLDNMLAAIQLKRGENVFIANVLKCRPPENRDPQNEEVLECDPFLKQQVELIKPKLIIALGKFAAQSLLQSESTIVSMRGQLHQYNDVPVIVTYHPVYLLSNLADKARAWEDLCFAKRTMQNL